MACFQGEYLPSSSCSPLFYVWQTRSHSHGVQIKEVKDSAMVGKKTRWALAAHGDGVDMDHWIIDSGASRHLVRDVWMIEHAVDCDDTMAAPPKRLTTSGYEERDCYSCRSYRSEGV